MGVEIERKFLINKELWKKVSPQRSTSMRQAYLSDDPDKTIRVRTTNSKAFLTIKGRSQGLSRQEFEYEIPLAEAHELIDSFATEVVEKTRHYLHFEGKLWEVDEFAGKNEGLWVAEVELESEDEEVQKPDWVEKEVTQDSRYLNARLAKHPYCHWEGQ